MATAGVLQIHPSLRCNLRCHHCYSSSGPDRRGVLGDDVLADLVSDAAALGYATLAVSGGEPLMFPGLEALLRAAREAGMRTMVTTNGTLVTPRRLAELAPLLDLLAFSLDGPPDVHNAVRAVPWAFAKLDRGLAVAAREGLPHGVLYTATTRSVGHIGWASDFAAGHGCALFQIHALEDEGRAGEELCGQLLGRSLLDETARAGVEARVAHAPGLRVHVDLARRSELDGLTSGGVLGPAGQPPILVVEADGAVVPMTHGFDRGLQVATLGGERLRDALPRFLDDRSAELGALVDTTVADLLASDLATFDVYAELRRASRRHAPVVGTGGETVGETPVALPA